MTNTADDRRPELLQGTLDMLILRERTFAVCLITKGVAAPALRRAA
jgi:hypothetical protein